MITYQEMVIDESRLQPVREALYHSNGPGYYIFRRFLPPEFTRHIAVGLPCRVIGRVQMKKLGHVILRHPEQVKEKGFT